MKPHSSSTHSLAIFASALSALAWAFTGIFVRYLVGYSPIQIVACRCAIGLIAFAIIFAIKPKLISEKWNFKNAAFLGFIMTIYYLMVVLAYQISSVAEVSILTNTTPLFTLAYKRFKGHHVTKREVAAIAISIIGVIMIIVAGKPLNSASFEFKNILGDILALIAGGSMALYSIMYSGLPTEKKPTALKVGFVTLLCGTIICITTLFILNDITFLSKIGQSKALYNFLGLGIIATFIPTLCYAYASALLPSITVTSLRMLTPLLSAILAIFLLQEIPGLLFWPGGTILSLGLFLIIKENKK